MKIRSQAGTSTGMVAGWYRVNQTQPGTKKNTVADIIEADSNQHFFQQVPGKQQQGSTHAHAHAHATPLGEPGQPGTRTNFDVVDAFQPGTSYPVPTPQPVTDYPLLSWIQHAQELLRSNPDIFPLAQHPAARPQAAALAKAALEGEDVPTLQALAEQFDQTLTRIRNGAVPATTEKPTVGRPQDRFGMGRKKAKSRTYAPSSRTQEVPMRATGTSKEVKKPVRRARKDPQAHIEAIQDALAAEYEAAAKAGIPEAQLDLMAHATTCLIPAYTWCQGDPLTVQFPEAFQGERLAQSVTWLKGLNTSRLETQEQARSQMVQALHQIWPTYVELCSDKPLDAEYEDRTWDIIDRLDSFWAEPEPKNLNAPLEYLPRFRDTDGGRISYSFHLTLLAVSTLNKLTGRTLMDFRLEAH